MHLALVISTMRPGGAERVLADLANYFVSQGHEVSLITLVSKAEKPFYFIDPRVNRICLNCFYTSLYDLPKSIFLSLLRLRKILKQLKPNAVISFLETMNIGTLIASKGLDLKVVISERTDPHFHEVPFLYKILRQLVYPWCFKLVVQTQDAKVYFSKKMQQLIEIIPNSVKEPESVVSSLNTEIKRIVTVGRLVPSKDHKTLIKAIKEIPNVELHVYGEGMERESLQHLIDELGLQKRVLLQGNISDVHAVLRQADLFVFPSLYEGFPNALCEAMSVGLPVIASNCSGNRDVINDQINGCLFPMGDVDALTKIIKNLIYDQSKRQLLSKNARKITEIYAPSKIYKRWYDLCAE